MSKYIDDEAGVARKEKIIEDGEAKEKQYAKVDKPKRKDGDHGHLWGCTVWVDVDDPRLLFTGPGDAAEADAKAMAADRKTGQGLYGLGTIWGWTKGQREQSKERTGRTNGRHYQIIIYLIKDSRIKAVQNLLGSSGHYYLIRDPKKASMYVWKDESLYNNDPSSRFEFGDSKYDPLNAVEKKRGEGKAQGKRSDLESVWKMAKDGEPVWKIIETFPNALRYMRMLESLGGIVKQMHEDQAGRKLTDIKKDFEVIVYWGPPGCGKTRRARWEMQTYADRTGQQPFIVQKEGGLWLFNGYAGEEILFMDELIPGDVKDLDEFYSILDIYWGVTGRVKGRERVRLNHHKIWITSMYDPKTWFYCPTKSAALMRRIKAEEMTMPAWEPPMEEPKADSQWTDEDLERALIAAQEQIDTQKLDDEADILVDEGLMEEPPVRSPTPEVGSQEDNKHRQPPVIDLSQDEPDSPQALMKQLAEADKEAEEARRGLAASSMLRNTRLVPNDPDVTVQLQPGSTLVASRATLNAIAGAHYSPMQSMHAVKWSPMPQEVVEKWRMREAMGKRIQAELEESAKGPTVPKMSASKETKKAYELLVAMYKRQEKDSSPGLAQAINLQRQMLREAELEDERVQQRSGNQRNVVVPRRLRFTPIIIE